MLGPVPAELLTLFTLARSLVCCFEARELRVLQRLRCGKVEKHRAWRQLKRGDLM